MDQKESARFTVCWSDWSARTSVLTLCLVSSDDPNLPGSSDRNVSG